MIFAYVSVLREDTMASRSGYVAAIALVERGEIDGHLILQSREAACRTKQVVGSDAFFVADRRRGALWTQGDNGAVRKPLSPVLR